MLAAGPELRITGAAGQTRMVSVARIRLVSRKSTRAFKGIVCDDISEFESHMPSQAVGSLWTSPVCRNTRTEQARIAAVSERTSFLGSIISPSTWPAEIAQARLDVWPL
jgi:hypothetical protein